MIEVAFSDLHQGPLSASVRPKWSEQEQLALGLDARQIGRSMVAIGRRNRPGTVALEIKVLGGVDALIDGEAVALGGSKQRAVLAMLALRANRAVTADELIDGLWGDRPPASAAKNVQYYVSQLRKALASDDSRATIVTHGRGYELQLPADAVDAARFEHLVERARREAERGIADGSARGALELWRGAPLADVASEPFAGVEIRRLEELHLRAIELGIDAELAAARHGDVIGRLEALLAEHPLHERFHAQRMLALYRAGRQSEAVEGYRAAHRVLAEIGVEPGPELRSLQEQILAHDPALHARPPPRELPRQLEGGSPLLAGRDRELRWLRKRWAEARAGRTRVALVFGPAGIGKTRLAAGLAADVQGEGATVLYAAGSGAPDAALEAIRGAQESELRTLLVLDDADDASPAVLEAAAAAATEPRDTPLLALVLHRDEEAPPAFAAAGHRLALRPLRVEAAAEIAELYAPADGVEMPLETLMAESDGVPLRVHRAASGWAQAQAAERLEVAAEQAAIDQGGLRTARAEVAGGVADLQLTRERTNLYVVAEPSPPAETEVCPFRGLAPFDSAHAEYFFGRERLVAELVARLVGSTLIAVVGPSGSGKSSVLRAGLLPALADGVLPGSERWRQVVMRPGEHPVAELRRALARVASDERAPEADDPIAAALDTLAPDERLVLAVDQLEEIFTACRKEAQRAAFAEALAALAADPDRRVVVVLGVRGDFYGRCAHYPELSARMGANTVLVGPMRRDGLRRAIELPARRAGLRVEPQLVSTLVGDVADEPGGLPLLSTTLVELWEGRSGRRLHRRSYAASGGVDGAVARLAERAYRRLSEPQRERARAILLRLADAEEPAPVRRRVPLEELEAERDEDTAAALAVLTESRLVTVDEGTAEVAHEALLREWPRLRAWLEEDAEGRRLHQHLIGAAREWEDSDRDPAELYRGARLASALDWASTHEREPNELERAFLEESRAASEHEAERQRRAVRRLRTLLAGVGVLLAAAVVAGVIALSERQGARRAATVADAERLGAQALTEKRIDQALRLASAGVALDDSVATRSTLLSTLLRSPAAIGVLRTDGLLGLALSPDGKTLAVSEGDGTVTLFDTDTYEVVGDHQAPGTAYYPAFDPQGDSLAVAEDSSATGTLEILDAATGRVRSSTSLAAGQGLAPFGIVTYAPDGRSLFVPYSHGDSMFLRRYDARRGTPLGKPVRVGIPLSPPLATPDGRILVTTDRGFNALDAETLRVIRRYHVRAETAVFSPDGRTAAIEPPDGGLRLLDLASGRVRTLRAHQDQLIEPKAFSPDGRTLSTAEDDGSVILWDVEEGVTTETFEGHAGLSEPHVFSPDGRTLYTAGEDGGVIVWDVAGDRRLGRPFPRGLGGWEPTGWDHRPAFALSPDGRALAVARLDGRVELIDAETLRRTASFEAFPGRAAAAIDYSADGRRLAVAGEGGGVGVWDVESGEQLGALLRAPRGPRRGVNPRTVHALAFGQGDLLAAAEVGGAVRIWDVGRRELLRPPLRLTPSVLGLAFNPDGSQLAIPFGAFSDKGRNGVEILDLGGGERVARLSPDGEVQSVAFSPDGSLLAGGQVDGGALLWATDGWRQVGRPLALQNASTLAVEFSPDGHTLATSQGGSAALWDVASQEPIGPPLTATPTEPGRSDTSATARFTPDGARLFVLADPDDPGEGRASNLGRAIRWEVDPEVWLQRACALGGSLTSEQWAELVPEQDYRPACPSS
jgi:DNA-binding SARP family transcriptional activator/WD40 repeat protein